MVNLAESVRSELGRLPDRLRNGPLAATAEALAELLPESSPRDATGIARELRLTLAELRQLAADQKPAEVDPVDELAARRAARLAAPVSDRAAGQP